MAGSPPTDSSLPELRAGAHMSIAGGLDRSVSRALTTGCDAMQVFTKSSSQWRARPLDDGEVREFRRARSAAGIPVVAHNSYLINMASPDTALWERSIAAMVEELQRCETLDIPFLICHPGAHMGQGPEAGTRRIARALDRVRRECGGMRARVALENAAGQGTTLGARTEEIGAVFRQVKEPDGLGVCIDTCHAFAAGYDLADRTGWGEFWDEVEREIGLDRLVAVHVNDSVRERGSRVDRHASLGEGRMGLRPFLFLANDPRPRRVPLILETPKGPDGEEDRRNLGVLRSLAGRKRLPRRVPA